MLHFSSLKKLLLPLFCFTLLTSCSTISDLHYRAMGINFKVKDEDLVPGKMYIDESGDGRVYVGRMKIVPSVQWSETECYGINEHDSNCKCTYKGKIHKNNMLGAAYAPSVNIKWIYKRENDKSEGQTNDKSAKETTVSITTEGEPTYSICHSQIDEQVKLKYGNDTNILDIYRKKLENSSIRHELKHCADYQCRRIAIVLGKDVLQNKNIIDILIGVMKSSGNPNHDSWAKAIGEAEKQLQVNHDAILLALEGRAVSCEDEDLRENGSFISGLITTKATYKDAYENHNLNDVDIDKLKNEQEEILRLIGHYYLSCLFENAPITAKLERTGESIKTGISYLIPIAGAAAAVIHGVNSSKKKKPAPAQPSGSKYCWCGKRIGHLSNHAKKQ